MEDELNYLLELLNVKPFTYEEVTKKLKDVSMELSVCIPILSKNLVYHHIIKFLKLLSTRSHPKIYFCKND